MQGDDEVPNDDTEGNGPQDAGSPTFEQASTFLAEALGDAPAYDFVARDRDGSCKDIRSILTGCWRELNDRHEKGEEIFVRVDRLMPQGAPPGQTRFACVVAKRAAEQSMRNLPRSHVTIACGDGVLLDCWRVRDGIPLGQLKPITQALARASMNPIMDPPACVPLPGFNGVKIDFRHPHIPAYTADSMLRAVCPELAAARPAATEDTSASRGKPITVATDVPALFRNLKQPDARGFWRGPCPAHEARLGEKKGDNLSVWRTPSGRWHAKCFSHGCSEEAIFAAVGLSIDEIEAVGLTLEDYAAAKQLPIEFLQKQGVSQINLGNPSRPVLRIPYYDERGDEAAMRFRLRLHGKDRFKWRKGSKPMLYGLQRLEKIRKVGWVILVEGESDWQTLRYHRFPVIALPGADIWDEKRDAQLLKGIEAIYIVIEPDAGGDKVRDWLARSSIRDRAYLVALPDSCKDPSALYLDDPKEFKAKFRAALKEATSWQSVEEEARIAARRAAWSICKNLARCDDILAEAVRDLKKLGLAGEEKAAKIVFLGLVSRLLDRPISIALKGPSSAGKSFIVECTSRLFPPKSFYALTAMSEKALAYSTEPLAHRMLVIYEAVGLTGEFASYLVRSLLSEGRIRYETVVKTKDGPVSKFIEREGPTGLIVTTTKIAMHPENETRLLSIPVSDTPEQTKQVMLQTAAGSSRGEVDLPEWHALQIWLANGNTAVNVPYASVLAELVPAVAVRLRRDFGMILHLIRAHALLHRAQREKDEQGRIIAELADYRAVRDLVADVVAAGIEATVPPSVRETVRAVEGVLDDIDHRRVHHVLQSELVGAMKLDRSVVSRRVMAAIDRGFLRNEETRRGYPSQIVIGAPMPDDIEVLPTPKHVARAVKDSLQREGCAVVQPKRRG
jgi:hypothetical protein